jgi:hypothetical protein
MMQGPKIHLSGSEMELMQNEGFILTKNRVLEKTALLLQGVQHQQQNFLENHSHFTPFINGPKISKGENYLGLPFLILDHPRLSAPDDLFFIRLMFWWGNFFSSTLHLSGRSLQLQKKKIIASYDLLGEQYIGINKDPWIHHFGEDNYLKVGDLSREAFENRCNTTLHLKIATRWPLSGWEEAGNFLFEHWKFLMECLA